jgi:acyl dehydratase
MPPPQNTMALLFTYLATVQANSRSSSCAGVGCFFVTTFSSLRASSWLSAPGSAGPSRRASRRGRCGPAAQALAARRQRDLQHAHVDLAASTASASAV